MNGDSPNTRREKPGVGVPLRGNPLVLGIDLAQKRHFVVAMDRNRKVFARFSVPHSARGVDAMIERARKLCSKHGFQEVIAFMEWTGSYWKNVASRLRQKGIPYGLVAPLSVHRKREIQSLTRAKRDPKDALLIARLGLEGDATLLDLPESPVWCALETLGKEHEQILHFASREKQRLRALLELIWPEYPQVFRDPFCKTSMAVLLALAEAGDSLDTQEAYLEAVRQRASSPRIAVAKTVRAFQSWHGGEGFGVLPYRPSVLQRIRRGLLRLRLYEGQRKEVVTALLSAHEAVPYHACLESIQGLSGLTVALLLGFAGDIRRFPTGRTLTRFAGMEPTDNESGAARGPTPISHRGRSELRAIACRATMGLLLNNQEFLDYAARLTHRQRNPLHYTAAMVATANKLLRVLHRLAVTGEEYDPARVSPRDARDIHVSPLQRRSLRHRLSQEEEERKNSS